LAEAYYGQLHDITW